MATSSTFNTSNQYIKYRIVVTETAINQNANTSTVNIKVDAWRTNTGYTTSGNGTCYANINGVKYTQAITSSQAITHNSHTVLLNKTVTIPHDTDGKKKIYVSAYIKHSQFSSNSQGFNVTLTEIPRKATITSAPNFNDTDNPTITYANPVGELATSLKACISLTGSSDDIAYRDISKTGGSYTFNLTETERNTLLDASPNSNTLSVIFIIKTELNGVTYYDTLTKTMTIVNANPVIEGATYEDINPATLAITNDSSKIIQDHSNIRFRFSSLRALKGAYLDSLEVDVNAQTGAGIGFINQQVATNAFTDYGVTNSGNDLNAVVTLTDSRGNETTLNLPVTVLAYRLPLATITLNRKDNYYDDTNIKVTQDIVSLGGNNSATIQYQYKEKSASSYGSLVTIANDTLTTITLDNTKEYDFKFIVTDRLGATSYFKTLLGGYPILFIDRLLRSVGIGSIPDDPNMLSVDRRIQLKNINQEKVLDLWSTSQNGGAIRSALFRILNQAGNALIYMNADGVNGNGFIKVNDADGDNLVTLGLSNANGGYISVSDDNGNTKAELFYNNGGRLWLSDPNGNDGVYLDGSTGKVGCKSMSTSSGEPTFTKNSGGWNYSSGEFIRSGNTIQVRLAFSGSGSSVSVGSNAIAGVITDMPLPPFTVRLQGYYSGTMLIGELTSSGNFNVRILGQALNLSTGNNATLSGVFIVE